MVQIIDLFETQRKLSREKPRPSLEERKAKLTSLETLLTHHVEELVSAINEDFGSRCRTETELMEIVPALRSLRHTRKQLGKWMKPQRRSVAITLQPAKAYVRFEPLGVVGIISPWNYPLLLAIAPLIDALGAGNRVMIKPSELTPVFSALLQRLTEQYFSPEDVVVVCGGVETAKAFSALPFDHLFFTGSTEIGRQVMQQAATNLTPVTLELGGKSPAIIMEDYALDKAAKSIAFGKFLNAGQTCIAPDYVLVPAAHLDSFAQMLLAQVKKSYPSLQNNPEYSAIISPRHHARLIGAIQEARDKGAIIYTHAPDNEVQSEKIFPTIVLNPPEDCLLMREEIFGPVLPIIPYNSIEDAISKVLANERPLALYCFTHDRHKREQLLDNAISGGVTLNGTLLHIAEDNLPFGGVGPSGIGAYHGQNGFVRLSHSRSVFEVGFINTFEKLGPPWGKLSQFAIKFLGYLK